MLLDHIWWCQVNSQQAKTKYLWLETPLNNFFKLKLLSSTGQTAASKLVYLLMYSRTSCKRPPNKLTQRLSGRLQKSNHRAPLLRRGLGISTLWKIIYCMQFLSYTMCNYMLLLKFMSYIPRSMVHTANKKIRECNKAVAYKRLRTMENHQTFRPKK